MDTPHVRKWDLEAPAILCTGRERGRQIVGCFALVCLTAAPRTIRASEALLKKRVARTPTNRLCVDRRPTTITMLSARETTTATIIRKRCPVLERLEGIRSSRSLIMAPKTAGSMNSTNAITRGQTWVDPLDTQARL